jgi:hypothetical protein
MEAICQTDDQALPTPCTSEFLRENKLHNDVIKTFVTSTSFWSLSSIISQQVRQFRQVHVDRMVVGHFTSICMFKQKAVTICTACEKSTKSPVKKTMILSSVANYLYLGQRRSISLWNLAHSGIRMMTSSQYTCHHVCSRRSNNSPQLPIKQHQQKFVY